MQPIFLQGQSCILADVDGAIIEVLRHLAASQLAESHLAESYLAESHLAESHLAESHLAESHLTESPLTNTIIWPTSAREPCSDLS